MHSKFLVIFFLYLCTFNKISKSSVIDHVEVFETEENLANETQVLETSTLVSTTFKDATDQPVTTLPIEKTEVPKVSENTDAYEVSENAQVSDHGTENTPETAYDPHVTETTYIPVPENTEPPNVPGSSVSTTASTTEVSETISKSTLPKRTTESVTRPSPPQRFVPKHRIEVRTPKKHAATPLFEMCPPLGEKCPACTVPQNQLARYMCYFPVVLKVLLLSPPETDASGRICGKLGKLLVHGTIDSKQFRSLLRFSIKDTCDCNLKVSQHYFLFTQESEFTKQGRVYSKISLSDQSLLVPVDPYTEPEILQVLRSCSPEQIGIIPTEEIPQDAIRVDSKHESVYTQGDLQSVSHHSSHQEFPSPDSTLQVSARSARNPYQTNPSANYLTPNTNFYLPPMLTPAPVQYPGLQMNLVNFPTMAPFRPFSPMPTLKPLFSHNQPQPAFYLPPLVYNNAQPQVHKSVAYSSSSPGHQVSVQTDVRYDSRTGSIKVAHSGMVPSSGTEYTGRPPITFPQGNQHMEHSSGTAQMSYEPPENAPKSSVNVQNAHVMTSSIHQNPEQHYISSSSFSSSASSTSSGQSQRPYVSTNCLNSPLESLCPYCSSYNETEFPKIYCNSAYAFLSTITFPDRSSRREGNAYECFIVQSQLLHDISKEAERHNLVQSLQLLLPAHCDCLSNQIDPAVILFLGNNDPQPKAPQTQLSKDHILILLPAPSDTTLPICQPYKTREEVKSAISYQPRIDYESAISPYSTSPSVVQDHVPEYKNPEVAEYSSTIPDSSYTENSPALVAKLDVKTPDYKPADYPEPAPTNTPNGATEPNYPEVSSAAPEPLQNYETVHGSKPPLSNPIPEASSKVVEHTAHYQQPPNEGQHDTPLIEKPAYEDGPPIHQPTYEASTPVPPVTYPVPPAQVHLSGNLQTLPQQPYETVEPQMQNYEAAKSSSHPTYIQEYESNICPSNAVQTCPSNNGMYEDSHAPYYCAAPFAIIVEFPGPGFQRPYYTFPRISIKTTSSSVGEGKTVVVSVSEPQPLSCSQRSVKIVKNIGTDKENFQEGNKIPIVLVSSCHFEYAARNKINRLLLHSPTIPDYLHNGGIQITGSIHVVSLDPSQPLPSCIVSRPISVSPAGYQNPPHPQIRPQYTPPPAPPSNPPVSPQNLPVIPIPYYPPYQPEKKLDYLPPPLPTLPQSYPSYPANKPPVVDNRPAHTQYLSQPGSQLHYRQPFHQTVPSQYPSYPENKPIYVPPLIPTKPPVRTQSLPYAENKPIYQPTFVENPPYPESKHSYAETRQPNTVYDKPYVSPMGLNKSLDYAPPIIFRPQGSLPSLEPYKRPEQPVPPPNPNAYPVSQTSPVAPCPDPQKPISCPTYTEEIPLNFHDLYCRSKFAMVVAVGIDDNDNHIVNREGPRVLPFLKPKPSNVEVRQDPPAYSYNVTVTRGKAAERRQYNDRDFSYKATTMCNYEVVSGLYDVSPQKTSMEYWVDLKLYVPISCQFSAFDNSPSYGILMSLREPNTANPIQLAQDFAFFPLPEGKLQLPTCSLPPHISPPFPSTPHHVVQYVPPFLHGHKMEVKCNNDTCGTCDFVRPGNGLNIPCDMRFAAVVEILETSAEVNFAPSLDIQHYFSYENHIQGVILNVKSNVEKPSYGKSPANDYPSGNVKCRYAKVKVVEDLSPYTLYPTKDKEITLIIPWNCKCHLFDVYSGYAVLMTKFSVITNLVVPITKDLSKVSCLPIGSVKIEACPKTAYENYIFNTPNEQNVANHHMSYSFSYSQNPEPHSYVPSHPNAYPLDNQGPYTLPPVSHSTAEAPYIPKPPEHQNMHTPHIPMPVSHIIQPDQHVPFTPPPLQHSSSGSIPTVKDSYAPAPVPELYPQQHNPQSYSPQPNPTSQAPQSSPEPYPQPVVKNSYALAPEPYPQPVVKDSYAPAPEPYPQPIVKDSYSPAPETYPQPVVKDSYAPAPEPYPQPVVKDSYAPAPEPYPQPVVKDPYPPAPAQETYVQQPTLQPPYAADPYALPPAVPDKIHSHSSVYEQDSYVSQVKNFSIASMNVYPVPDQHFACSDYNKANLDDCPVCEEIRCMKPEVYCNSKFTMVARPTGVYRDEYAQAAGSIITLYDISSHKPAHRAVKNIFYKIPKQCSCPILEESRFIVVVIEDAKFPDTPPVVDLDAGDYVYSTFSAPVTLPSCTSDRPRSAAEEIVLPPVQDRDMPDYPDTSACPNLDYSCPMCPGIVGDDELKNLVCSSDNVIMVSLDDDSKNGSSSTWWKKENVIVTQHIGQNYSIGIKIEPRKFESRCNLPEERGDCDSPTTRFHFDVNEELCYAFEYFGCNGNANNFKTEKECEETCIKNYNCTRGNLSIHKGIRSIGKDEYETFQYALPEHCDCPLLTNGKMGYLLFNSSSSELSFPSQLNENYKLFHLSESQLNMEINCGSDIAESKHVGHSTENSTTEDDVENNTIPTTTKKSRGWFG